MAVPRGRAAARLDGSAVELSGVVRFRLRKHRTSNNAELMPAPTVRDSEDVEIIPFYHLFRCRLRHISATSALGILQR